MATERIRIDWEMKAEIPEHALCCLEEKDRALLENTATDDLVWFTFFNVAQRASDFSFELKSALERIGMGLAKENRVSGPDYYTMVLVLKRLMESGSRPSEPDQGSGVEIVIGKLAQGG